MSPDLDVAIVGGGHNGLTAAWYLAHAGLRVAIFERRSFVGGAAVTEELWPGYRFLHLRPHGPRAGSGDSGRPSARRARPGGDSPHRGTRARVRRRLLGPADHESPRNLSLQLTAEETGAERRYADMKRRLCELFAPYRLRPPPTLAEARAAAAARGDSQILEDALTRTVQQLRHRYLPTRRLCATATRRRRPPSATIRVRWPWPTGRSILPASMAGALRTTATSRAGSESSRPSYAGRSRRPASASTRMPKRSPCSMKPAPPPASGSPTARR